MQKGSKWFVVGRSIVFLLVLSLALAGCGQKQGEESKQIRSNGDVYPENGLPKNQKVILKFIFPVSGMGKEHFAYAVETFQKKFPNVQIDVQWIEGGNAAYRTVIQSVIQSGDDEAMYDWLHHLPELNQFIDANKVEPQDELWERSLYDNPELKVKDVVMGERKEIFAADGHMYRVPYTVSALGIYYNKKLFRQNGWNMHPKNWQEFLALSEQIKAKGIWPMVMAGKYASVYFEFGWAAIPYEVGGDAFREAEYKYEKNIYKSEPFLTMLRRLEEYASKGYLHPGTATLDHMQSQMEFVQGQAAMITNGAWIANEMASVLPKDFEWGFMPMPGNDPGQDQVVLSMAAGDGYIWKNRPALKKKWVKEFNLWLLNLDIQKKYAEQGGVPIRRDFYDNEENLKSVSPSALEAIKVLRTKGTKSLDYTIRERIISNAEIAKVSIVKNDGYISLITKKKSAEQVADEINRQYMKGLAAEKK